jgi:ribosomal protein L7/L12
MLKHEVIECPCCGEKIYVTIGLRTHLSVKEHQKETLLKESGMTPEKIAQLVHDNGKIGAIKSIRTNTPLKGLKEAKELVEFFVE